MEQEQEQGGARLPAETQEEEQVPELHGLGVWSSDATQVREGLEQGLLGGGPRVAAGTVA